VEPNKPIDKMTKKELIAEVERFRKMWKEETVARHNTEVAKNDAEWEKRDVETKLRLMTEQVEKGKTELLEIDHAIGTTASILYPSRSLWQDEKQTVYCNGEYYTVGEEEEDDQTWNLLRHLYKLLH